MNDERSWPAARIACWIVFAAAFGFVEATVVFYLRRLLQMPPGMDYREVLASRGLPISSAAVMRVMASGGVLRMELLREAATLLLLAGAAGTAGRTSRERWALFGLAFAMWDLAYYAFLYLETGFPRYLNSCDIYFLIPVAWYGPVWFPVLVVMPAIVAISLRVLAPPQRQSAAALERSEA